MGRRRHRPPPPKLVPPLMLLLLLVSALLSAMAGVSDANTDPLPTTGPSPYLIAPAPPTGTQSAGDLSSSQPYWRDPNQIGLPFPPPGAAEPPGPRQGVSPPPVGGSDNNNGTDPSSSGSPPSPSSGTSPGNETAPMDSGNNNRNNNNSTLTRGAQLLLPPADPRRSDPFAALAVGVAGAFLPPMLAAKAAEIANAAAAKVFAKKAGKNKKKKPSKLFCPLSPADRDLLRTATGAALGAGAEALAGSATPLELSRCAVTLRATRPAAFQWVLFSGGRVNPCSIVLGQVSQTITEAIVEGKCYVPPESTAATSAAAVGS